MAKDAKGHGSDGRGGRMSVPDQHQHRIAVDTVKNPLKGTFLGGMNADEAEKLLTGKFGYSQATVDKMKGGGAPAVAAEHNIPTGHLNSQGHAWGSPAALADFKAEHGGPRDHAAEQRSFNSAKRETGLAPGGRHGYNPEAVNQAIASSNRAGRRIGGKEAAAIHRLLKGRG